MFKEARQQTANRNRPPQIQSPQSGNTGVPQPRAAISQSAIPKSPSSQSAMPSVQRDLLAQNPPASQPPSQLPVTRQTNTPSSSTASTTSATPTPVPATPPTSSHQSQNHQSQSNQSQSHQSQVVELLRLLPNAATRQQIEELKQLLMHLIQQMQQMEGLPTSIVALKKRLEQTATSSELEAILKQLNLDQEVSTDSEQQKTIRDQLALIIHTLIDIKKNQNPSHIQKLLGWKLPNWKWKDKAKQWAKPIVKPLGSVVRLTLIVTIILGIIRMGEMNQNLNLLNSTLQNSTRRTVK